MLHRPTTDDLPHHRVNPKAVGVVHVFIAREAREDRLAQEAHEPVPTILAGARIGDQLRQHVGQAKGVIQLSVQ